MKAEYSNNSQRSPGKVETAQCMQLLYHTKQHSFNETYSLTPIFVCRGYNKRLSPKVKAQ